MKIDRVPMLMVQAPPPVLLWTEQLLRPLVLAPAPARTWTLEQRRRVLRRLPLYLLRLSPKKILRPLRPTSLDGSTIIFTDLENITDARDFLFLVIYTPLQVALCISFLYAVLGWSPFVGMIVMVLGIWAPVQIGKWTHSVQVKRMKAVCPSPAL